MAEGGEEERRVVGRKARGAILREQRTIRREGRKSESRKVKDTEKIMRKETRGGKK